MGEVQNAVQFHVDDGDVQVAEGICQDREENLNKEEIDSFTNRLYIYIYVCIRDARLTLIVRWMNSWPKIKTR